MSNEWAVRKTLDVVEISIDFTGRVVGEVKAVGRCSTKRRPLWVWTETRTEHDNRYSLIDHVHHLLLVSEQDRPTSLELLEQGLCGGQGWQSGFDGF